ncbi:ANTAR domain-containing protein [Streptomyces arenae]|uniref:ANTAR domain-containing protein n=1 Tax=Streptomyces arenae TaxID=29301 RepID=UPI002659B3D7|nr:ANTAR domain-containing protein [Streptomyces arenae]MCG7207216.1 ANTAR domain-containing protein [Streptomyces arenae]
MTGHQDLHDKIAVLQREVDQLRHALVSHAVVDQAIGVLRAVHGLGGQESWDVLQQVSQNLNVKLREVAADVLRWADSGRLPARTGPALREAVAAAGPTPSRPALTPWRHPSEEPEARPPEPGTRCVGTDAQPR